MYRSNGFEELTRRSVDEGIQRMKVSGLLFNLSLNWSHISQQTYFVLASPETTSVFPSSSLASAEITTVFISFSTCCPLLNLRICYCLVIFLSEWWHFFISSRSNASLLTLPYSSGCPSLQRGFPFPSLSSQLLIISRVSLCLLIYQCAITITTGLFSYLKKIEECSFLMLLFFTVFLVQLVVWRVVFVIGGGDGGVVVDLNCCVSCQ